MITEDPSITMDPLLDLVPVPGQKSMMWADYLVFALILVGYVAVGLYQSCVAKNESAKEFINATGQMPLFPVVLSLLSSVLSAIIILGGAAEIYTQGAMYWLQGIGQWLACMLAGLLFVPLLYPLQLTSSYEYLQLRFQSRTVRLCGTLYLCVSQLFYMGVCVYSPATAMEAVTGFPTELSIVVGCIVAGIYVVLGGMKSSIWVGAAQAILMLFGTMIGIIKPCIDHPDGIAGLWKINEDTGRLDMWNFDPNPLQRHTFWTLVVGNTILWSSTYGVNQASVQRYCSVRSQTKGMWAVFLNGPGLMIFTTLCAMSGGTIFGWYYYVGCDPLEAGYIDNSNQVLPYYIMDRVGYPTIPGLFMAALFAGALSSMAGSLGALASCTWQDLLAWKFDYLSERKKTIINKILLVFYTAVGIGFGFMVKQFGGTVLQLSLSLTGACAGPLLGLFVLGGLFPCAEWIGATISSLVALGFCLWLVMGTYIAGIDMHPLNTTTENCINYTAPDLSNVTYYYPEDVTGIDHVYTISYLYYSLCGLIITVFGGLIISLFAGCADPRDAKPYLHIPICDRLLCCIRDKSLDALRFGWSKDDLLDHSELLPDTASIASSKSRLSETAHISGYMSYDNKGVLVDDEYKVQPDHFTLPKLQDEPPSYNGIRERKPGQDSPGSMHSSGSSVKVEAVQLNHIDEIDLDTHF